MRVHRSRFSKLKTQYEMLKMRAAYIMAEQYLIDEAEKAYKASGGIIFTSDSTSPEEFYTTSTFAGPKNDRAIYEARLEELAEQGRKALAKEDYKSMAALKQAYDIIKKKIDEMD